VNADQQTNAPTVLLIRFLTAVGDVVLERLPSKNRLKKLPATMIVVEIITDLASITSNIDRNLTQLWSLYYVFEHLGFKILFRAPHR